MRSEGGCAVHYWSVLLSPGKRPQIVNSLLLCTMVAKICEYASENGTDKGVH